MDELKSLSTLFRELDPEISPDGARVTGDIYGRVYIPQSLHEDAIRPYAKRRDGEFLAVCIRAARDGNSDAVALLALMAYNGYFDNGRERLERARQIAELADKAKNVYGTFVLGLVELESDRHANALTLFDQSADAGFPASAWFSAKLYETGIGTAIDYSRALDQYLRCRTLGYLFGDISYSDLIIHGPFGLFRQLTAILMVPYYRLKFELRNIFGTRFNATHLVPRIAVEHLTNLLESRNNPR